jgi:hypothetical protein
MYRLFFNNYDIDIYRQKEKMRNELEAKFGKSDADGLDKFYKEESKRYEHLMPCLQKDYSFFRRFFEKEFISSLPFFALGKSLFGQLGSYFKNPKLWCASRSNQNIWACRHGNAPVHLP